jgi:hypothetical protein
MSHPAGASLRCGLGLLSLAYGFGAARVGEEVGLWIKGSRRGRQLHHSAIRRQRLVESLERDRSGPICLAGTRVRDPGQSSGTYDVCAKTFYSRSPLSNYGAISKARPGPRAERSPGLRPCRLARGIPHFPPQLKGAATRTLNMRALPNILAALPRLLRSICSTSSCSGLGAPDAHFRRLPS